MAPGVLPSPRQSSVNSSLSLVPFSTPLYSAAWHARRAARLLRRSARPHLACALLAGAALAFAGCEEDHNPLAVARIIPRATVSVAKAERRPVPLTLEAVGAVEPIHTAAVRAQVTGTFKRIAFAEGQEVKAGDLLFEIDPRPFRNALEAAEADLQKVRVQQENARLQVSRYTALNDTSPMISQEQLQTLQSTERVLTAQLAATETAVANARLQLDYCSIRAPISGRAGARGAHEGELVRANEAGIPLVTINQLGPIYVTFGLPQQHLGTLNHYRAAGTVAVQAIPAGANGAPTASSETGELSFVDNAVDATTGTLRLKATFPNASELLWPGQFVSVRLTLATPEALVIPATAVRIDQKGRHVFIVKPDGRVELRPVTLERITDREAVIASGLTAGETVVTDGQSRLISGLEVDIRAASPATPIAGHPSHAAAPKSE